MFDPFVTSKPEGVGLGLALAQAVAAEHGGEVSWGRVDGETVFTISLLAEPCGDDRPDTFPPEAIPFKETRTGEVARVP
jgi:nitrogen-specific signal transduction histidine kinase